MALIPEMSTLFLLQTLKSMSSLTSKQSRTLSIRGNSFKVSFHADGKEANLSQVS